MFDIFFKNPANFDFYRVPVLMSSFNHNMRFWRKKLGLPIREMAEMLEIPYGRIQEYEKKSEMRYDDLIQLCIHNHIKIAMFLTVDMNESNYVSFFVARENLSSDELSGDKIIEQRDVKEVIAELAAHIPEDDKRERYLLKEVLVSYLQLQKEHDEMLSVAKALCRQIRK